MHVRILLRRNACLICISSCYVPPGLNGTPLLLAFLVPSLWASPSCLPAWLYALAAYPACLLAPRLPAPRVFQYLLPCLPPCSSIACRPDPHACLPFSHNFLIDCRAPRSAHFACMSLYWQARFARTFALPGCTPAQLVCFPKASIPALLPGRDAWPSRLAKASGCLVCELSTLLFAPHPWWKARVAYTRYLACLPDSMSIV